MSGSTTIGADRLVLPVTAWSHRSQRFSLHTTGWVKAADEPALVHFIHGNGLASLTYSPFLKHFADDYGLCLQDIQGHGRSDTGKQFMGWNEAADVCLQAFAAVKQEQSLGFGPQQRPIIGMGHSLGAILTLLMAAKEPDLFAGLILLDPVLFPRHYLVGMHLARLCRLAHRLPMAVHARRRRSQWASPEAAWDYLSQRGMFRTWDADAVGAYITHNLEAGVNGELTLTCPSWLEAAIFASAPRGLWQAIGQLRIPTYIYYGTATYPWIAGSVARAAAENPQIRFAEVEGGGHCFMLENPQWAYTTIKDTVLSLVR